MKRIPRFLVLVAVVLAFLAPVLLLASDDTAHVASEHAESGHGESAGAHDEHGGAPHLPNLFSLLHSWGLISDHVYEFTSEWINVIYSAFTAILLSLIAFRVYANRKRIPGPFQNAVELVVELMYNFLKGVLGHHARRYTPFLGTLFFYILINNIWGLVPLGHSPSTSLNITASLAGIVFLYSQYTGLTQLGIVRWLDHLAGEPRGAVGWAMVPLIVPIHIIGEFAKPFSLAVRLFGNITGEDVLVAAFVGLGIVTLSFIDSPIGLPLNIPFIMLGLMLSTIQALVFTILSSVYLLLMLPQEEH